jgi:peptidoglycan/xylan/chitin deacetylase (PgdA/CDA1 family)
MITPNFASWQGSCRCMLTFHRAAPAHQWAGLPNRDFYLNLDYLDRLLGHLKRDGWKIVTVSELTGGLGRKPGAGRFVNFSVDDCYRDTWEHVVPLFRRHGVPVTLFVTTGIPDGTMSLGWAGLESILAHRSSVIFNGGEIDVSTPEAKRAWYKEITSAWDNGRFDQEYGRFCHINGANPEELRRRHAVTWDMLSSLRDGALVEIGAHTISHPRISALTPEDALRELAGSRERLRSQLGVECRHMAFPYGRGADCGPRDFALARQAGFASAATTRKALVRPGENVFSLPRNTINGAHQSMLYANALLSGAAGFASRVLGRV